MWEKDTNMIENADNKGNDLKCKTNTDYQDPKGDTSQFFFISKMQLMPLFLACANLKMVACFHCEPTNRDFQLWGERYRKCG